MPKNELKERLDRIEEQSEALLREFQSLGDTLFQVSLNHLALFEVLVEKGMLTDEDIETKLNEKAAELLAGLSPTFVPMKN